MTKRKKNRRTYTLAQKQRILGYADRHGVTAAENKFDVYASSIYNWRSKLADSLVPVPKPNRKVTNGAPTAKQRAALELFQAGWSTHLVGEALGTTAVAVETLLRDALRNMKRER
jgi:transposase-like protein